ncbi:MAG: response regulator [bacterium]|nr:response regulator [bacterium]
MRRQIRTNIYLLLFISLLTVELLFPQVNNGRVSHYGIEDGLSQNQVQYITQDSKGFIWIGTQNGLNRFDGYNFKVYRHNPKDLNSLSDYPVHCIAEDKEGSLWIGTRDGLNRFDPKTEKFFHYHHNPEDETSISSSTIWLVLEDSKNNLWIATRSGLNKFIPEKNIYERYYFGGDPFDPVQTNITSVVEDHQGFLWISKLDGLVRFNPQTKETRTYRNDFQNAELLLSNRIVNLYVDSKNTLWIGSNVGVNSINLNLYDEDNPKFEKHVFEKTFAGVPGWIYIRRITEDQYGNILFATLENGLLMFKSSTGLIERFFSVDRFPAASIISLLKDRSGVLWAGSDGNGLFKIYSGDNKFNSALFDSDELNSGKLAVNSLLINKPGEIWIGTDNLGIIQTTIKSLLSKSIILSKNITDHKLYYLTDKKSITSLLKDRDDNIWVGTYGEGILIINQNSNSYQAYKKSDKNSSGIKGNFIHSIYEDSKGYIWICTGDAGIFIFDKNTNTFADLEAESENYSVFGKEVHCVIEDRFGDIWFGTTLDGLFRLDRKENIIEQFKHLHSNPGSVSANRINSLYKDSKGNLWIGTFGGGLNKFNYEDETFEHYTTENGLSSNSILAMQEDDNGNLWISTDKGLNEFDPVNLSAKSFDEYDGIAGNAFSPRTVLKDRESGYLFFGGVNGISFFNPSEMIVDKTVPPVVLTDFKVFNNSINAGDNKQDYLQKNISYADEISIGHQDNVISFEFSALHFVNPGKNQFAYMLEGFDNDWIYAGNRRYVTYTNLDPGNYIFKVKASNSDGIWNEKGIAVKLYVAPPWWQTWWAYLLYAAFFITILYSLRQYEMKRVKLRNELQLKDFESKKLQEVDQLKSHFFANISHEFRTPLTLILGLLQKFESKSSDRKELEDYGVMKRNALRLLQLINQLLELSKIESGKSKLVASENDIVSFVKRIFVSFASYAEQKKIKLQFNGKDINEKSDEIINLFFDKDKMEKIISNLVSNAVKYTPAENEIEVKISSQNKFAEVKVVNTGITISKADLAHLFDRYYKVHRAESELFEGTGIGLALVKELVELHKGTITASSEYDVTEFTVKLPLGKTHLKEDEIILDSADFITEKYEAFGEELSKEISDDSEDTTINEEKEFILIVEDHSDLRKYIRENLSEIYHIIESPNGKDGLNKAVELIPDLIISDVMMPEMDGYTFCKKIKTDAKTNHIPVILLTAKASTEDKLEGLELGADDYLIKPFNPEELKLRVRNLIRTREQLRQKFTSEMVLKPAEVIVPSTQMQFMKKIQGVIENNLEDESFGVDKLAGEVGMSRSQLHRKLKAITNQSTTEFIRNFRLQRAAQLILQDAGSMGEIAYKVGFNSQAYFNKSFQEVFGCSPSEYKKSQKKN